MPAASVFNGGCANLISIFAVIAANLPVNVILFAVQVPLLMFGEMSVVLGHISVFLPLYVIFFTIEMISLMIGEFRIMVNAGPLVMRAPIYLVHPRMRLCIEVHRLPGMRTNE